MTRTAIQLTTLRELEETIPEQLELISETGLEGVEFGKLSGTGLDGVATVLDRTGLEVVAAQVDLKQLTDDNEYRMLLETYAELGCKRLVVPDLGPEPFASETVAIENARRLSEIANRLAEDDFELLYHIQFSNMADDDVMAAFETFVDELSPAVGLQVDTGRARYAGVDPMAIMKQYPDRIRLVHLTDAVGGSENVRRVELGAGEVDLERCVQAAQATSSEWLIYEHQQTNDPIDSLTHAATLLPQLGERSKDQRKA